MFGSRQLAVQSLLILATVASIEGRSARGLWDPSHCPTQCVCRAESSLRRVYCDIQDKKRIDLTTVPSSFPDDTEYISLSRNKIATIPAGAFARLSQLRYLLLSSNELQSLPTNVFHGLTSLKSLDIANNKLSNLPSGLLSGLISLQDLYLDGNVLQQLPTDFFTGLTSLRRLFLNNNQFHTFSEQLFGFRGEIKYFRATPAMSTTLTPKTLALSNLTSLEELLLNHNGIEQVQHGSFNKMSVLKRLKLNDNNISTLPRGLFRQLRSLRLLSLYNNPFQCTCSLRWLKHWILRNDNKIKFFHKHLITCRGPPSLSGKALVNVTDKEFACLRKQFTSWSPWSPCTKSCGGGRQSRTRNCTQRGTRCKGNLRNWRMCHMHTCDPGWGEWSAWTPCNATCSLGHQTRTRTKRCAQSPCQLQSQARVCVHGTCPQYSQWSPWSACDHVCGEGKRTRNRTCTSADDGITCVGPNTDTKMCFLRNCAEWAPWSAWTTCSTNCSAGTQSRKRECTIVSGSREQCGGNETEQRLCNLGECPVHGWWSVWSPWSGCSRTCGMGYSIRYRNCSNPAPLHGGGDCKGRNHEITVCTLGICSEDSHYTPWSPWTACSSECGKGTQKRSRNCTQIDHVSGVPMCFGNREMYRFCEAYHQCDRAGAWAEWSLWSDCNGNCKEGRQFRWRFCKSTGKIQGYNGAYVCDNNQTFDHEERRCTPMSCDQAPVWSIWSYWSQCSKTCGRGTRRRQRFCLTTVIGQKCLGPYESKEPCNTHGCPVDGGWSEWGEWGNCSQQCDGGLKQRSRTCTKPSPANNGHECISDRNERTTCNLHRCADYVVGDSDTGTPNPTNIELKPRSRCPDMEGPAHGRAIIRKQKDGNTYVEYKCDPYFRNKGASRIRMCLGTGEWNGEPAACVLDCGEISSDNNVPDQRLNLYGDIMHMNQSWPWQAAIKVPEGSKCGGSLYGDQWIITAAHCVLKRKSKQDHENITVQLGSNIWADARKDKVQVIPVEKVFTHTAFDWRVYSSDIAVLKLQRKVDISSSVHPVCLPVSKRTKRLSAVGNVGVVVGWGSSQGFLRQMPLPVVSLTDCIKAYSLRRWRVTNKMLCAGFKRRDTCRGDSGGGYLFRDKTGRGKLRWILGGIVSWGNPTCAGKYSVFVNVAKHVNWIRDIVEQN